MESIFAHFSATRLQQFHKSSSKINHAKFFRQWSCHKPMESVMGGVSRNWKCRSSIKSPFDAKDTLRGGHLSSSARIRCIKDCWCHELTSWSLCAMMLSICIFCKILESISDKLDSLIWWSLRRKTFFLEVMNYFRFFGKHHWHSLPECPNTTKGRNAFGTDMVVALRQKEGIFDGRLFFLWICL